MRFYQKMSKIGFLKNSYVFKFLFVAFVGIHIPLIGLLLFVIYGSIAVSTATILWFSLVMTLVATAITFLILKKLIRPIEIASQALVDYKKDRTLSALPVDFNDEAGLLMRNIHESILENEKFIVEKQDLVYLLSHDLKTFAGNPQSLATFILESNPSDAIKELAELIYQSSSQQFQYIENFIKLLKEQDTVIKSVTQPATIQFGKLVSAAESQLRQILDIKKIRLVTEIELQEADIKIDEDLLLRVIINLIDNAIKFSFPDSEIKMRIYSEKAKAIITVQDSGIGFDPSKKEELFKKFTKMSQLGTSNEGSTGIGLYLCRKIIEKSDGKLTAYSKGPQQGATFTIIFK